MTVVCPPIPVSTFWRRARCHVAGFFEVGGHRWHVTVPIIDTDLELDENGMQPIVGKPIACVRCGATSRVGDPF